MTIKECEKRNKQILADFEKWKHGECVLETEELIFLCTYFKVKYPNSIYEVSYSAKPNHFHGTANGRKATAVLSCLNELSIKKGQANDER